jgi:aminopeptidase
MKPSTFSISKVLLISLFTFAIHAVYPQKDWTGLAKKIVENAGVQPGEVVIVSGGQHTLTLMEAIAIESNMRGGQTTIFLNTDKVEKSFFTDMPEQFLSPDGAYWGEWVKHMDVFIGLPGIENTKEVYKDIPQERFAKIAAANQKRFDVYNNSKVRIYSVSFPTPQNAQTVKLDFDTYEKIMWSAMNADYRKIAAQGEALKKLLESSKTIKVTSPDGTGITFSVTGRPVLVRDGVTTKADAAHKALNLRSAGMPDGRVTVTAMESSANGKVVVAKDLCDWEQITNINFEVKKGKVQNINAATGKQCFDNIYNVRAGDKDMFGGLTIGLNPALKPVEDFIPFNGSGIVHLQFGENRLMGGKNSSTFSWNWPILNATVEIDGKVVVKDGKVML